jgi:hypothetical protein
MLILKTLALAPMHGWGISERIQQWSAGPSTVRLYGSHRRWQLSGSQMLKPTQLVAGPQVAGW